MASTVIFRRLLLPSLNMKKTLGHTVLLTKSWNCVTSQFYPISCGEGALAKKNINDPIVKPAKEKKSGKKPRSSLTNNVRPADRSHEIKTIDIPVHFQRSEEVITLPTYLTGYKFIKKEKIEEVTKGFKQSGANDYYIMPNGVVSTLAKYKENYEYKVTRKYFVDESKAKNKLSVINVESKKPDLKHSNFQNYSLVHHYVVESKGDPSEVPDVTKHCIRTVEPVEALEKTLKQFARTVSGGYLITKNDKGEYVQTDVENDDDAVATIQFGEYNHTHDNNIKAIHMQVTAFSGAKELKKLENLGFLQVYSKEKQVLIHIKKILAKLKTLKESDGGDFSIRAFEKIEKDESLVELHRNKFKDKYFKVEGSFKNYVSFKVRPSSQHDLECQKYHFVSTQKPITDYHVWEILKTTDKELKPFIGKCLVQKLEKDHQTITIPGYVFKFMLFGK